ncbi:MAG: glyoxalase [Caulobacteraceae bacterium]|jgi:predicted enzyme related to lactoylglutathione lyase|nr:glyoxalase [Caulobacteraceae bacterium]
MAAALVVSVIAMLCQRVASAADVAVPKDGPSAGHVTGVGGVFFKSKDPKALAAWYRDVMGIKIENWGGATLPTDAPGHPPVVVWSPYPDTAESMAPSSRDFSVNFAVDDLDTFSARLAAKGVDVHREPPDPNGTFAWILDPDGTKIELWQPTRR